MRDSPITFQSANFEWRPIMLLAPEESALSSSWAAHLPFAYWIVDVLRPTTVVDIANSDNGAYSGFCQAADKLDLSTCCYALTISDLEGKSDPPAMVATTAFAPRPTGPDTSATKRVRLISSLDLALGRIKDGSIDILHIDDACTPGTAERLFHAWKPKMSHRGIMLVHGIMASAKNCDLLPFWLSVSQQFPSFVFPHAGGLVVLGIGSDLPEAVRQLFAVAHDDSELQSAVRTLFERLATAVTTTAKCAQLENEVRTLTFQITTLQSSTSWHLTKPFRLLVDRLRNLPWPFIKSGHRSQPIRPAHQIVSYKQWIQRFDTLTPLDKLEIGNHISRMAWLPTFSIVMPVYNIKEEYLRRALDTVLDQFYEHWELCIADDASSKPHVAKVLAEYEARDPRIKVVYRKENGHVAVATNSALALASGDFVLLMDHDDELPPHCLYMIAAEIEAHPDAEIIYSDEDKIDAEGNRWDPYFKSDWNPDLVCGQNMISHVGVYKRDLLEKIGGFRSGFEGSQDYDLMLRASELTTAAQIRHIPSILYHWRVFASSGSISTDQLDMATQAARRAVGEHLARTNTGATVGAAPQSPEYSRVSYPLPAPLPLVSLIVPTKDKVNILSRCIDGLLNRTNYDNIEILIVDNNSEKPETLSYFDSLQRDNRVHILKYAGPFNYSAINNFAVSNARGTIIGLINNDIDVITPDWLREMVAHALRPTVGAVGAKLFYADNTIQHAGVILGMGGVAGHPFRLFPRGSFYFQRPNLTQNVSAVTAACLVVRKRLFEEIGGLDEVNLPVAFNDVDFCIRLREAGYLNVWTPFAELYHLESATRGNDMHPDHIERFEREIAYMENRWRSVLANDPYYNPNLALDRTDFSYAFPPRIAKPWNDGARSPSAKSCGYKVPAIRTRGS